MRIVEIRRRRPEDGEVERLARVFAREPGEEAEFEALEPEYQAGIADLLGEGITDLSGRRLHLADGDAFVAALPDVLRGSRFWAEEVAADEA